MRLVLHVVRILVPVLLVVVVVGALASLFTARPDLQRARRRVDTAWAAVAPQLGERYALLATADKQVDTVPGPVHAITAELDPALARWQAAVQGHADVGTQVSVANTLEALGRRLLATATASPRVKGQSAVQQSLAAYAFGPRISGAADYNATVAAYERQRRGPVRAVVASLLGEGDIPALDTTSTGSA
ncbi:MAG TPA: hypothetical protein VN636_15500 [Acidimicrobiia bacterium]|nr:hypothetical protein [Acidimicrobiia bacterium]